MKQRSCSFTFENVSFLLLLLLITTSAFANLGYVGKFELFYGNLHSHTSFSDGRGTPEEAYAHASKYGHVLAVTDHCYYLTTAHLGRHKLELTFEAARRATVHGFFAGLVGFEWTGGSGHINVFESHNFVSRNEVSALLDFYKWLTVEAKLAQFNHPGRTFGNFHDFQFFPDVDRYINLIEVGNGSSANGDTISQEALENFVLALNRGWHVSPTANQDNHRENWLSANQTRTGIWSRSLTREDILEALWNRRTFASEDSNVRLWFEANGHPMGSVIGAQGSTALRFKLYYLDDEPVDVVIVHSQSGVVFTGEGLPAGEHLFEFESVPPDSFEWYFVYVRQLDGDEIVSAPIWYETVGPLKVNYVRIAPANVTTKSGAVVTFDVYNDTPQDVDETLVLMLDGETVWSERVSLRGFQVVHGRSVELPRDGLNSPGIKELTFVVGGEVVQSLSFKVLERLGPVLLVDTLHENDLTDAVHRFLTDYERSVGSISWPNTILSNYEVDYVLIPTPSVAGLDFFKDLLPEEVEWLEGLADRVLLLRGSDEFHFERYRATLPSARVFPTVTELYEFFRLPTGSLNEKTARSPVVLIDQGHGNDYTRDKLTKLENFILSRGYKVSYLTNLQVLDGTVLIIMNGKDFSEEEMLSVSDFVRSGGRLIIASKGDYKDGGNTEDLNRLLEHVNSPVRFNDDQVEDEVSNYGAPYKVLAGGVRFYSPCSLIVSGAVELLVTSETARSVDADRKGDAQPVDRVVLAAQFTFGAGYVVVLGKAIFSDFDFDHNSGFIEKIFDFGRD